MDFATNSLHEMVLNHTKTRKGKTGGMKLGELLLVEQKFDDIRTVHL
jgi:hypothetical protein